jgi:Tfp pilus assembly protein PilX
MGSETNITGSSAVEQVNLHARGFTLVASLLLLLLLSGLSLGLLMMVNTENKVGGTDLQNNLAFHAADGGIEKMASDLSATFANAQSPHTSDICNLSSTSYQPVMVGVTWTQYSVQPASGCTIDPPTHTWGQISAGADQGLWAQIIPINMLTTAALPGGQEVSMTRTAQVALIPVFQYGVFCEGDCGFFDSPNLTFAGRVHTNNDLYLGVASGYTLTFNNKLEAYGNVVTEVLPNGLSASAYNDTGNVYIPTTVGGCIPNTATNCVLKPTNGNGQYGDGSVVGAGGNPVQSGYNGTNWNPFSKSGAPNGTNYMLVNGNYGSKVNLGTGAQKLSMPFVNGTNLPYQIIRRALSTDSSALSDSREYNLASIRVLLSDDPAEFQNGTGATDPNNVRLANVPANSGGTGYYNPYGIPIAAGNYPASLPSPSPNTYSLYFATASNAIPSASCTSASCAADWPYPPAPWTPAMMAAVGAGTDPNCTLLCPTGAPFISLSGTNVTGGSSPGLTAGGVPQASVAPPSLTLCPTTALNATGVPALCSTAGSATFPYYLANSSTTYTNPTTVAENSLSATWNLIDGWLRVEYKDASGAWHPVTNEWLQLGFARGLIAPTLPGSSAPANGTNPINPNAILLLQEPADRVNNSAGTFPSTTNLTNGTAETALSTTGITGTAPACTHTSGGKCTAWSITPPQVLVDTVGSAVWQFGSTTTGESSSPQSSSLLLESATRFNWYPINFYDAREGEPRDTLWSQTNGADNTCTSNGIMNAVEIDVGNLKRWLAGSIGSSGTSVDYAMQNGYVLYFSDRRGMLPNPNPPYGTTFAKSGDAGLEDVINANGAGDGAAGTPDGLLEPVQAGHSSSPEDVNQNTYLDSYGTDNLGLGFYGTGSNVNLNLNYQVVAANPNDSFGTASYNSRIASCSNARKNWVSGARHVLKLVDGSLGNLPTSPGGTLADPGGFTVASENPVYIQGNYNSNSADLFWSGGADQAGHAAAAVIADAVTILSNNWVDQYSTLGNPNVANGNYSPTMSAYNRPGTTTYYRVAIAGGKNMAFNFPSWENSTDYGFGTDGGVHNFLRFLEDWQTTGATLNYGGSLVSLYYATYGTGVFKCCEYSVYQPPVRNYIFDSDFTNPSGLPPGTPMFRDVETLSFRQLFATRQTGQ